MLAFPDSYSLNGIIWGSRGHPQAARRSGAVEERAGSSVRRVYFFFFCLAGVGDHMIPEAFPPAVGLLGTTCFPSAVICPFATPPSVLQPKTGVTLASHGSSALLVCGSLGALIYRKTHKHRSHFLCLRLGFLLSQNRPVTPRSRPAELIGPTPPSSLTPRHPPAPPRR